MILIFGERFNCLLNEGTEITILGYYGMDNFGDDLMLKSIIEDFSLKKLKINILAYREISWLNSDEYPHVKVMVWPDGKLGKLKFFRKVTKNSSIIAWGGGTCFTDEDGDGYFKYMVYSKLIGKKVVYLGVGIGNLNRYARKLKTIILINISNALAFREKESLNKALDYYYLKNINKLYLVEDPANRVLNQMSQHLEQNTQNALVVAWRDLSKYSKTTIGNSFSEVIECCNTLCEEYNLDKVIIMDTDSVIDPEVSLKLVSLLEKNLNIKIVYDNATSYESKMYILNSSKVILTSRLHIAVAAKYLGKQCFVYNYSPKIKYYVEEINEKNIKLIDKDFSVTN